MAGWTIDTVPVFDIGADQADPHQEFSRPSDPVRLSDGRIAIAEPGAQEVRFFDSAGVWLRSVGRQGQGPGEFGDLGRLFLGPGDSLYAYEPGTGYVSVLDRDGNYIRRVRLQFPGEGRFAIFSGVFDDGRWLLHGPKVLMPASDGVFREPTDFFEYSAEGARLDSIARVPGSEVYVELVGNRGRRYSLFPFRRSSVTAVSGPRLYFGPTERIDLTVLRSGTGLERIVRIGLPERVLTREMVEAAVERQMEGWRPPSPAELEEYRAKMLGISYPSRVPAIEGLAIAANGDLWFREQVIDPEAPVSYVVADSAGRFKAFATGPARFTPSWIGADRVIGLWRDPDGVVHVRGYRLRR